MICGEERKGQERLSEIQAVVGGWWQARLVIEPGCVGVALRACRPCAATDQPSYDLAHLVCTQPRARCIGLVIRSAFLPSSVPFSCASLWDAATPPPAPPPRVFPLLPPPAAVAAARDDDDDAGGGTLDDEDDEATATTATREARRRRRRRKARLWL